MLSSKEGFSFQGLDIDAISDITGISIGGMDQDEQGSQHSGSVASDNTELLLNQNVSLRELDGDDLLLDSVSQVGEQEEFNGVNHSFSVGPKQNASVDCYTFLDTHSLKTGAPNDFIPQTNIMQNQHGSFREEDSQSRTVDHEHNKKQSISFTELKDEFSPEVNNSDGLPLPKYLTRKFASDTNIASSGRQSVIKHHSSMPSVKMETSLERIAGGYADGLVGKQAELAKSQEHRKSQQVRFHPDSYSEDDFQDGMLIQKARSIQAVRNSREIVERPKLFDKRYSVDDNSEWMVNPIPFDSGVMFPSDERDFGDHERHLDSENGVKVHLKMGPVGDELYNSHYGDDLKENNTSKDAQEMLLGVRHDPDTNELYDDKVREGADLLSRILGGDHSGSFSPTSSSERNDKPTSRFLNQKPQSSQQSLDFSPNTELKLRSSSSPRQYTEQSPSLPADMYVHPRETVLESSTSRATQVLEQGSVYDGAKKNEWQPEEQFSPENSNQKIKNGYDIERENKMTSQALEATTEEGNSFNNDLEEVSDVDELLQGQMEELKRLELDIEEIHSRKKMAMHELTVLEESLSRNKADMNSSVNLVEQYRWQATQTRSELMELEERRNQLQEECNKLTDFLRKSKRNESFNSDDIMFGRSKEEIFTSLQERDKFKNELETTQETLKREKERAKWAQDDLREKIRTLEEDLKEQHQETVDNLQKMKEERASNIELMEEKFKREANHLKKAVENAEMRIKQLETSLVERNEEVSKLRVQHREEKQKNLDLEKNWRAQLESERQDAEIRMDEQERSFKDREEKLLRQQSQLENLVEERTSDLRRSEERCRTQTEELHKIIENKNEEVKLVRGLVRQQEDATRVLGERLRTEAREHVRNAVEKERQSLSKDKERINRAVEEEKEKNARILKQLNEQIELEKENHSQTKQTMNKLRQESENLRKQLVEVHGERITSVQRAREEGSEELEKIKEKLHEFTIQTDKLERIDKETAKAIYEECRKVAELVGMPVPFRTPTRLPEEKPGGKEGESPTKEALVSLRRCNDELRQRLADMKKQMDKQRVETDQIKKNVPSGTNEDTLNLQKRVEEKEEEIQRLHKKYGEEILHVQTERKKEQMAYRRTVAKLEQEFQKLTANVSAGGTSRVSKRDVITRNTVISSGSEPKLTTDSPTKTPSRSAETSSSTDLLKHLQDRVKKLRAENENLKKSEKETSHQSAQRKSGNKKGFGNAQADSGFSQSKRLTISQLRSPAKNSDLTIRQNSGAMTGNMEQVVRLQRLLASTTKEDSKSLQTNTG